MGSENLDLSLVFGINISSSLLWPFRQTHPPGKKIQVRSPFWSYWPFGGVWRQYVAPEDQADYAKIRRRFWITLLAGVAAIIVRQMEITNEGRKIQEQLRKSDIEDKASYDDIVKRYNELKESDKKPTK